MNKLLKKQRNAPEILQIEIAEIIALSIYETMKIESKL